MKLFSVIFIFSLTVLSLHAQSNKTNDAQKTNRRVLVYIHKQTGNQYFAIENTDAAMVLQYELSTKYPKSATYRFKTSEDSTYYYVDEFFNENYFDSLASLKLNQKVQIDHFFDVGDKHTSMNDLEGKIIVLNFWATWCRPCVSEMPELNLLVNEFKENQVVFLAPTNENQDKVNSFRARIDFDYEIIPQANKIIEYFRIHALPTHVIIDQKQIVRFIQVGGEKETIHGILAKVISECLQEGR